MCGIAMVRLLKPLDYYQEKYGTWQYGLQKMYLLMEKQHNRGQEGAGLAAVKLDMPPGEEYIWRERLAKLSKDERAKEEENKRLSAIEERERAVAEKEMRIETQTLLAEKGLPSEFLNVVLAPTAEEVKDNIENLQAIFDSAVETRVNERLTQKAPRMGTGSASMTKEEIMAVKDDEERLKLIAAHRNLF
jgi:hypothetical protein